MWSYQCMAKTKKGKRCTRESKHADYVFDFQDESFDQATWIEVCGNHHLILSQAIVTSMDINRNRKQ